MNISFPPVGGTLPFLITCDGKPFASFATREHAERIRDMYASNQFSLPKISANAKMAWAITER